MANSGVDALNALGLKGDKVESIAWMLVQRSLLQAMSELAGECNLGFKQKLDFKLLCEQLDYALQNSYLSLTRNFFSQPKQLPIVKQVQMPFRQWLISYGLPKEQAESLSKRLPRYFVFALNERWRVHSPTDHAYTVLREALSGPFESANDRELAWMRYAAWLQRRVDEPMFAEAFGLRQVYVPLRAYYNREVEASDPNALDRASPEQAKNFERCVVDLETAITDWLTQANKDDAIRVICGGPGCGKSSFGRMLAAHLTDAQTLPVLFIPLHQFNPSGDLVEALNSFLKSDLDDILPPNPLEKDTAERQVLLIFDGLDELSMQGNVAAQVAQNFVREVQTKLLAFNRSDARVFALLSGRDLAIENIKPDFRRVGQILHVLPYFQIDEARQKHTYVDPQNLLQADQRHDWWRTYGKLKDKPYQGLPDELNQDKKLIEITAQPLLNYLVALSYDRKAIDFSTEHNLNVVYNDLLEQVYKRDWAGYQHPTLGQIEQKDFIRILEEIAIACWHGNGRTTTIVKIAKRCASGPLKRVLDIFEGGANEGVTRLLTAFYFKQSGVQGSESTFEFTHKSFGEYLTARRIVLELQIIQRQLTQHHDDPDLGLDEKACLKRWAMLCGPMAIDDYLLSFLRDEVKRHPQDTVAQWQQTLAELISYMLRHGMPMEELTSIPKFIDEITHARNASEAMLAALSSCAWVTQAISQIDWLSFESFSNWLIPLQGQRVSNKNTTAFNCLNHLDLKSCNLQFQDLIRANLVGANLVRANLVGANLVRANLVRANLVGANLVGANLGRANLVRANLVGANLEGANLVVANLSEANLGRANLVGANLVRANLVRANLEGAKLGKAHLIEANLGRANLVGANLGRANLVGANLGKAHLGGAYLVGAKLVGANLVRANLEGANLEGAKLVEANLEGAKLEGVNLVGANLVGANLVGANLRKANLGGANLRKANLGGAKLSKANLRKANLEGAIGIETAINVPEALKSQLGL
ncbi:MAG: pentapeptide repeat-containing protein [Cyanobacteria bacterium J06639_14]